MKLDGTPEIIDTYYTDCELKVARIIDGLDFGPVGWRQRRALLHTEVCYGGTAIEKIMYPSIFRKIGCWFLGNNPHYRVLWYPHIYITNP